MTQFNPAVQHRVLGTWVCLLLFLSLVSLDTGDESLWFDPSFHNNDDDEELSAPIKTRSSPAASSQPNQPQRVLLEPDSQGSSHLNTVYVKKKVEDSSAVDPQARASCERKSRISIYP
ncbi:hypothetical protein FRC04_006585 [Tulasnella sp. 424]|nr:hypothetical protein FRC04_006585 [Tulasnella sp. 424]